MLWGEAWRNGIMLGMGVCTAPRNGMDWDSKNDFKTRGLRALVDWTIPFRSSKWQLLSSVYHLMQRHLLQVPSDVYWSGWWFEPLWKIWKSIGMMTFPIYGKIIQSCSSHHQPVIFREVFAAQSSEPPVGRWSLRLSSLSISMFSINRLQLWVIGSASDLAALENHRKTIGKPYENHTKTIGKP